MRAGLHCDILCFDQDIRTTAKIDFVPWCFDGVTKSVHVVRLPATGAWGSEIMRESVS